MERMAFLASCFFSSFFLFSYLLDYFSVLLLLILVCCFFFVMLARGRLFLFFTCPRWRNGRKKNRTSPYERGTGKKRSWLMGGFLRWM